MKTDELPIVITPLKSVQDTIAIEHRKAQAIHQDDVELKFNRAIETGLESIKRLTDVVTLTVPHDLDSDRLRALVEKYQAAGWTMHIIQDGKVKHLRFTPLMDHQYEIIKPS